jgi:hypothetical protein
MNTERESQISAPVSPATRALLEKHVRATGVKKGHLIEEAILYHLYALEALPADIIVHPRIVVSRRSGREIVKRIGARPRPTSRLRALMSEDGD